jgi:hypothetical protein
LNGVILLSQILNFDDSVDGPQFNPGVDLPYELALPTYAATAWYHHKLNPQPAAIEPLLREVESFAMGEYSQALAAGSTLPPERKAAIAAKLSSYIGCRRTTSSARICGSTAANSRKTSWAARSPPAGSIPVLPGPPSTP